MNKRRKLIVAFGAGTLVVPLQSLAQKTAKFYRLGFLSSESAAATTGRVESLRAGLRDLGYVEGKNIAIEYRWSEGKYERLPELASELVRLNVDVLVTYGTSAILAARQMTITIPIVMATAGDAVATGFVASLARPGGNVTGSTIINAELSAKRLELLKEAVPNTKRVALLMHPDVPLRERILRASERVAGSLKLELHTFEARGPDEFPGAFAAMAKRGVDAVSIHQIVFFGNVGAIAELAAKHRLPSIGFREFADAGGLIGYSANFSEMFRRAAVFVDKILKGAKPADIPVEQPTKFEFFVNLKTAKALGVRIPQSILVRADKVIE